jgi:hypothetical protein
MGNPSIVESYDSQSEAGKKLENFFKNLDKDIAVDRSKREFEHSEGDEENPQEEEKSEQEKLEEEKKEIIEKWKDLM